MYVIREFSLSRQICLHIRVWMYICEICLYATVWDYCADSKNNKWYELSLVSVVTAEVLNFKVFRFIQRSTKYELVNEWMKWRLNVQLVL